MNDFHAVWWVPEKSCFQHGPESLFDDVSMALRMGLTYIEASDLAQKLNRCLDEYPAGQPKEAEVT